LLENAVSRRILVRAEPLAEGIACGDHCHPAPRCANPRQGFGGRFAWGHGDRTAAAALSSMYLVDRRPVGRHQRCRNFQGITQLKCLRRCQTRVARDSPVQNDLNYEYRNINGLRVAQQMRPWAKSGGRRCGRVHRLMRQLSRKQARWRVNLRVCTPALAARPRSP